MSLADRSDQEDEFEVGRQHAVHDNDEADNDNDIAGGGAEAGGTRSQPSNPPNLLSGKRATF